MAQDGTWQAEPEQADASKEAALRAEVEGKLGKLSTNKIDPDWQARREYADRRHAEGEAIFRRQFALEQAAGVVKATLDWHDHTTPNAGESGTATLTMADSFAKWLETGTLPQA